MPRRAERLLGACLFAALCGCANLQESSHAMPAPAPEAQQPAAAATTPAVAAETKAPSVDVTAALQPRIAPDALAARTQELLREAEQYTGLPPETQQRILAEAELKLDLEQTPHALVRHTLLLSVSEPDRQSSAEAAARLRDLLDAPAAADRELEALARLLMHVLDEREHLLAQNVELQRKLNQLKAIEQQLGDRDGADAPQPAP